MKQVVPNFFLAGAVKSGSTSLYHYLNQHPQIFMSSIKEPHYFSSGDMDFSSFRPLIKKRVKHFDLEAFLDSPMTKLVHRAYLTDWNDYLKLFKNVKNEIAIGEASTSYLWSPNAAQKIKEKIPGAKIIVMLRNPIERAYSHYLMDLKINLTNKTFSNAWKTDLAVANPSWGKCSMYMETGLYNGQVKRYMDQFGSEQIRIILFEDFIKDPGFITKSIFDFLGVDSSFTPDFSKKYNASGIPFHPLAGKFLNAVLIRKFIIDKAGDWIKAPFKQLLLKTTGKNEMDEKDKLMLRNAFEKDIVNLQQLIHKDLSHWLT